MNHRNVATQLLTPTTIDKSLVRNPKDRFENA